MWLQAKPSKPTRVFCGVFIIPYAVHTILTFFVSFGVHFAPYFNSGHGTRVEEAQLIATVSGFVERVNKLVSVRPLNSRYYV